ncbi:MAG TPA: hypothetical protein EYN04_10100 [Porticoccaceae bacterium]|nr:hypothetical protein [Porticoccaceae bacterium]
MTTRYILVSNLKPCQAIKKNLPVLHATVGGFSRLWLGSVRANALTVTGEIHGEQGLLDKLEQSLSLPLTKAGWEF